MELQSFPNQVSAEHAISKSRRVRPAPALSRRVRTLSMGLLAAGLLGAGAAGAAELAPRDLILLDRLTWGINATTAAHLQAVGTERWLQEQLHPAANMVLAESVRTQIEAMADVNKLPFDIAVAFEAQARSANQVAD